MSSFRYRRCKGGDYDEDDDALYRNGIGDLEVEYCIDCLVDSLRTHFVIFIDWL